MRGGFGWRIQSRRIEITRIAFIEQLNFPQDDRQVLNGFLNEKIDFCNEQGARDFLALICATI